MFGHSVVFPCTIKSRNSLLAPAHLGSPGKNGRKTVVVVWFLVIHSGQWTGISRFSTWLNVEHNYMLCSGHYASVAAAETRFVSGFACCIISLQCLSDGIHFDTIGLALG